MHATEDLRPRVTNPADAAALVTAALAALDTLEPIIVAETGHLQEGRVKEALALDAAKADAGRRYTMALEALKANAIALGRFAPDAIALLKRRHQHFSGLLQYNITVLSTVRSVSEGLIRELAAEVGRGRNTAGYTPTGQAASPYAAGSIPLAVSKVL
jgi:hypothetical protein